MRHLLKSHHVDLLETESNHRLNVVLKTNWLKLWSIDLQPQSPSMTEECFGDISLREGWAYSCEHCLLCCCSYFYFQTSFSALARFSELFSGRWQALSPAAKLALWWGWLCSQKLTVKLLGSARYTEAPFLLIMAGLHDTHDTQQNKVFTYTLYL